MKISLFLKDKVVCTYLPESNFVGVAIMQMYPGCICDAMKYAMERTHWWNVCVALDIMQTHVYRW